MPASVAENGQVSAPASIAPASAPAAGKVQKSSRRQSSLQAAPENIAKALNSMPEFQKQQVNNGTNPPMPPHPFPYPDFGNPSGALGPSGTSAPDQGSTTTPPEQVPDAGASAESQKSGCCSNKSKSALQAQQKASCCGKRQTEIADDSNQLKQEGYGAPAMSYHTFTSYPAFPGYWPQSWQDINSSGCPPPPQNLTFDQSHSQIPYYTNGFHMQSFAPAPPVNFAPVNFNQNMNTVNAAMPQFLQTNPQGYPYVPPPTFQGDPTHECNCGDDCQCLGCAAHPFNDTTWQHVQQMGYMMAFREDDENSEGSDGCRNTPLAGQMSPTTFNYPTLTENNLPSGQGSIHSFPDQASTQTFNSGFSASHAAGQQLMQPSQYYTVEYPVGLLHPCSDVTGSCQCGNDCSCEGCLTHTGHNAASIQPSAPESTPSKTTEFTAPSSEPPVHTQAPIPTIDDLAFSPLSPPPVEPQVV